ncbi:MAG: phosphoribosylanthranilate isomerase [Oscillospiraceae bacterium]|nr:phosphoribosylanthranilate isomerase [Oscillospiraceae bacterium]
MKKKVKLCGLSRPEDVEAVNRLRPDYCGFVIDFPKSHRSVTVEQLRRLRGRLAAGIPPVGVFVDQPVEQVGTLLELGVIWVAQLHGGEDGTYIARLRRMTSRPIWQAFQIHSAEDVKRAAASAADFVLLDAGQGGGKPFAWDLLEGFPRPFGLAGGLNEGNLAAALATQAQLVDVSGGVETDGVKDPEKMERFVAQVRAWGRGGEAEEQEGFYEQ